MRKKGQLLNIALFSLVFSFMAIIYIFISVFTYSVSNDYLFYELQNMTETLESQGIIKSGMANVTQQFGEDYGSFNLQLDNLWLIAYIIFIVSSFSVAYKSKNQSYFSFLSIIFYCIMVFLFFLTFFSTLTNWFKDQILDPVLPTAYIVVPKFYYYLDHIGIFSAVHLVICALLSVVDFDLSGLSRRKQIEKGVTEDNEIV